MRLFTWFGKKETKDNLAEIEVVKAANNKKLDKTVKKSVAQSKQAGEEFDKIGLEMQLMAEDIAVRIAKATRALQS